MTKFNPGYYMTSAAAVHKWWEKFMPRWIMRLVRVRRIRIENEEFARQWQEYCEAVIAAGRVPMKGFVHNYSWMRPESEDKTAADQSETEAKP